MINILYEDNHLIAVYKRAGVPIQSDASRRASLMDEVKLYLKKKYNKPGKVFLGLLHRLDQPVSGIVLFAKTSKGASRLSEQIRNRTVEKIYHALAVEEPPEKRGRLINYLRKDREKNVVEVFDNNVPGSQYAELEYEVVGKMGAENFLPLLKIHLITGRPHQIRAQLARVSCPIAGDVKYGGPPSPFADKSIALCATSLKFRTATGDEERLIEVDAPEEWKIT